MTDQLGVCYPPGGAAEIALLLHLSRAGITAYFANGGPLER